MLGREWSREQQREYTMFKHAVSSKHSHIRVFCFVFCFCQEILLFIEMNTDARFFRGTGRITDQMPS